jgi:benzylsuccinate CoA-transferase BbsF subunit
LHRARTGQGQWIDMSCTDAGATLLGPSFLDYTVNGRPLRRPGMPDSNRSQSPEMAPHGVYPAAGHDEWVAIACRDDAEWERLAAMIGEDWATEARLATLSGRLCFEDDLDRSVAEWTKQQNKFELASRVRSGGVPASAVQTPAERIDRDPGTSDWGLWPTVEHSEMGQVRVDGLPVHLSKTDWEIRRGAPCLGEDNDYVFGQLLGLELDEVTDLRQAGVL